MTPRDNDGERWRRTGEILEGALEHAGASLEAYLAKACAGDRALEADVRSLLESHRDAGDFLENEVVLAVPDLGAFAAEPIEGTIFGAWRVVRQIGEGGMGAVYLAERGDGQFRQQGALKVIRRGQASEEMIRRFRRERQILASLDHPGIARLLDGGSSPEGLPWLVMEYVEGRPLYEWCSESSLPLPERLRLFLSICDAVQAAHQRLVLHRDIKPGNILVTRDGLPRLLDFGVAKIFSDDLGAEGADLRTVSLPLTPEYASPEQLKGEGITVASDIYSLGVVLFELVTGARPYPTRAEGTAEMIRVILEKDPPRPSTALAHPRTAAGDAAAADDAAALSSRRAATLPAPPSGSRHVLRRKLSGDLDNIVLKAMNKDPQRRYVSAERFADDIRRYLDGRPVSARAATWSYRTGKLIRRNRLAAAATALAVVALVAGLVATSWQAAIARRERGAAEVRLRQIQSMANALLFDVHDSLAAVPGTTPVREMVVSKATEYLDRLAADAGPDSAVRFGLGDAYFRLSGLQGQVWIANVGKAGESFESMQRCREIRESLLRDYPDNLRALHGVMMISALIGLYDFEHDRAEEALAMHDRALECSMRLIELAPDVPSYRVDHPKRLYNTGLALVQNGRTEEGTARIGDAVRAFEDLARREPEVRAHRFSVARGLTGYAAALLSSPNVPGTTDSALAASRRLASLYEALSRDEPVNAEYKRGLGTAHAMSALIYSLRLDRPDSALASIQRSGAIFRDLVRADPGNQDFEISLAIEQASEGQILALAGQAGAAEAILRPLLPKLEAWARADSSDTRFTIVRGEVHIGLGLAEMVDARHAGSGEAGRARWAAARVHLESARAAHARQATGKGWSYLQAETGARIDRALAACDSALQPQTFGSPSKL